MVGPQDRWWIHLGPDGEIMGSKVKGLMWQQTHEEDGSAGILELEDGQRFFFSARMSQETTIPPDIPAPIIANLSIIGDPTQPGSVMIPDYDPIVFIGTEGETAFEWFLDGVLVGTEPTYTLTVDDDGKTLGLVVTPITIDGRAGGRELASVTVAYPVAPPVDPPPPPLPGPPPAVDDEKLWVPEVPAFWRAKFEDPARAHPVGPGPINGPHPESGDYLSTITGTEQAAIIGRADAWDPNGSGVSHAYQAMDVVIAHQLTGYTTYVDKANVYLERMGATPTTGIGPSGSMQQWSWMAASVLADHLWDEIDPTIRQQASDTIAGQLLALTHDHTGKGWQDMVWEGWPQRAGLQFLPWALAVWGEVSDPTWDSLVTWFGDVWYRRYCPWHWRVTVGRWPEPENAGASWPQQSYWASNMGGFVYHAHLAMTVFTGEDHFMEPKYGGWYGRMIKMNPYRQLPDGTDIGIAAQTHKHYAPYYVYKKHTAGFPHFEALAFATRDPVAVGDCERDGQSNPRTIYSLPWSHFYPSSVASAPRLVLPKLCRFQSYRIWRSGFGGDDMVVEWAAGDSVGHHMVATPGHFMIFARGGSKGMGGRMLDIAPHYGQGSDSEQWHGSQAAHVNGCLFYHEDDEIAQESRPLWTSPSGQETIHAVNDGACNWSQNPWGYRVSQTPPLKPDCWLDYNDRKAEFELSRLLGTLEAPGVVGEVIDWSPGFRSWRHAGELASRPKANSRVDRLPEAGWVRSIAIVDEVVVVIDLVSPLAGVMTEWQAHFTEQPMFVEPGLYHVQRHDLHPSKEGSQWPHALSRSHVVGNSLQLHGDLWIRTRASASDVFIAGGPDTPVFCYDGGVRRGQLHPLPGKRQHIYGNPDLYDPAGPEGRAPWKMTVAPEAEGPHVFVTVLSCGDTEEPTTTDVSADAVTVEVRGRTLRLDRASFELTL